MEIKPYYRKMNYYETDQMQVVHHSNYPRFLEECRLDMMEQAGISYERLEELGIIIPVLEVHCIYRYSLKFNEEILIIPKVLKLSPVRFTIEYKILDYHTKELKHTAETSHCFVDREFKPLNLKKAFPEIYDIFQTIKDEVTI